MPVVDFFRRLLGLQPPEPRDEVPSPSSGTADPTPVTVRWGDELRGMIRHQQEFLRLQGTAGGSVNERLRSRARIHGAFQEAVNSFNVRYFGR